MHKILAALMISALISAPALASDSGDALAAVHQFTDALNKGDMKSASAACSQIVGMIDDLPPYEWHGEGACGRWLADAGAYDKAAGFMPGPMVLGKPRHAEVTETHAYLVIPASFTYSLKGEKLVQTGSLVTVSLTKEGNAWRMTSWAWSDGKTTKAQDSSAK